MLVISLWLIRNRRLCQQRILITVQMFLYDCSALKPTMLHYTRPGLKTASYLDLTFHSRSRLRVCELVMWLIASQLCLSSSGLQLQLGVCLFPSSHILIYFFFVFLSHHFHSFVEWLIFPFSAFFFFFSFDVLFIRHISATSLEGCFHPKNSFTAWKAFILSPMSVSSPWNTSFSLKGFFPFLRGLPHSYIFS